MKSFNLSIPTKLYFGDGILQSAIQKENSILCGNVMIITGKNSMRKMGYIDKVEYLLKKEKNINNIFVYEGISPNPRVTEINTAIKFGIENIVNTIIGLGGGSAIDAAKAIAVGIGAKECIEDYVLNGKTPTSETLPIVAIPTTSGTGSELSKGAIVTFEERKIKTGIRGDNIYPRIAIVDPSLTYSVPDKVTRETGFDVFTHATETYISKMASSFTELLSIEALKIVAHYLPILVNDRENKEARIKMSYASMIMGINLGNGSTCLPHRLQYPIGALTDTSHSAGLASIYKAWIYYSYEYSKEKFNTIGSILSGKECKTREDVIKSLNDFLDIIRMNINMSDLGVNIEDLEELCETVTGSIDNDPSAVKEDIIRLIYVNSL
jgi:alcohol dehydrogenase class IV